MLALWNLQKIVIFFRTAKPTFARSLKFPKISLTWFLLCKVTAIIRIHVIDWLIDWLRKLKVLKFCKTCMLCKSEGTRVRHVNSPDSRIVPSCPWDQGGMIFVSSARHEGGATAKLQEPGWGHIQGRKMILGSQAGGELLYHHELLVFPQNASPWILQISAAVLSYIFLTFS